MNWKNHSNLVGNHAFLGASSYHWLNYDNDKLISVFKNNLAKQRGTELHELAERCIELGVKLPDTPETLNLYVNDAIGFKMRPEQVLYYSDNCFGTADAICFRNNFLRIHDLKTGQTPVHMEQLFIYAALFCLEYHVKPGDIDIELRIYQNNDYTYYNPKVTDILPVMDKIVQFDKLISEIKKEEGDL